MIKIDPIHCTYCGSISEYSAERADRNEMGEDYECPRCERSTSVWDESEPRRFDNADLARWRTPDSLY